MFFMFDDDDDGVFLKFANLFWYILLPIYIYKYISFA